MSIVDELITDRTGPGKYDWTDYNRVGTAVEYIAQELREAGYTADVITKTNWIRRDIQTMQQMEQYIANIQTLRTVLKMPPDVPPAPETMRFLTWQTANAIEQILLEIHELLWKMRAAYRSSNAAACGGDMMLIR